MKSALFLGATSDIARALAHRFAQDGYRCILACRRPESLDDLVKDLHIRYSTEVETLVFDALDRPSHPEFANRLNPLPSVTVCAFGCLGDAEKALHDTAEADLILQTNYNGAVSILDLLANRYEEIGQGTIIGISSVAGDRGRQSNYHYGSSKAGFTAYLSGLRNRLAKRRVHVMTVKPGFVDTRMTEGRDTPDLLTAQPKQVAAAIFKAYSKNQDVVYCLWVWRYIMLLIRYIPESIFKKFRM